MSEPVRRIVRWARSHENIRAVRLVGSRANPEGSVDEFSDYDIELFVRNTRPFTDESSWPEEFGEIAVRWPLTPRPTTGPDWITQLVQYRDGLRIDFQITGSDSAFAETGRDAWMLLLDKETGWVIDDTDEMTGAPPASQTIDGDAIAGATGLHSDRPTRGRSLHVDEPATLDEVVDRVNSFWWDVLYVGKALCRGELNLARFMLESVIRFEMITPLLRWYAVALADEPINTGLSGRRLHEHLPESVWQHYLRTFAGSDEEDTWRATLESGELVGRIGEELCERLLPDRTDASSGYPSHTDEAVSALLGEQYELWRRSH